ncbi:MAG: class I SAM-dependent RNA methyltransferase [Acidimicrobiia bacterium]|nr:class I SAM-dependent RNA methyltransferase [Acidimicrobiia bacterium]
MGSRSPRRRPRGSTASASADAASAEVVEVVVERPVAAGRLLARQADGRVVLVEGALPGERVRARVHRRRARHLEAVTCEVIESSSDRVAPPCAAVAEGCGGCDLQHARPEVQLELKVAVVADALARLGGLTAPPVRAGAAVARGGRTTVRAGVDGDGRAGLRKRRSHDLVVPAQCPAAHPLVEELLLEGRFPRCEEVTLRCGAATGERLVLARPAAGDVEVPDDAWVVGEDEVRRGRKVWLHEVVAGEVWRISAPSFFQSSREGADALVAAVTSASSVAMAAADEQSTLVDLYAGVGLLAGTVGRSWPGPVVAVERARSSTADAEANLRRVLGEGRAVVHTTAVEAWRPCPAGLVVADPARSGLGATGVARVAATATAHLVLVSCDAAALGRDTALLAQEGFSLVESVVLDMFPDTHHVEVVSRFER